MSEPVRQFQLDLLLMENIKVVFARQLKAALVEKGWNSTYFAERIGKSHSTVSLWLSAETAPHLEMLQVVAEELGIDPHRLIDPRSDVFDRHETNPKPEDIVEDVIRRYGFIPPKRLKRAEK